MRNAALTDGESLDKAVSICIRREVLKAGYGVVSGPLQHNACRMSDTASLLLFILGKPESLIT
jgi:hypothetical protein